MKNVLALLIILLCQVQFVSAKGQVAQSVLRDTISIGVQDEHRAAFMPLDSVPMWVKNKVSSKEYEQWKKMSHYFNIDYSVLDDKMYESRKNSLYRHIRQICHDIEMGTYEGTLKTHYTFVLVQESDTCLQWEVAELNRIDEDICLYKREAVIYRSSDYPNVGLVCTIWYVYNSRNKDVYIISRKYTPTANPMEVRGGGTVDYIKSKDKIHVDFGGILIYYDDSHTYHEELVKKAYLFSPSIGKKID